MRNDLCVAWSSPFRLISNLRSGVRSSFLGLAAGLLCVLTLAGCQGDLYTNLDEKQANEIVAALLRNYIPAERVHVKGNVFSVRVDEQRFAEAVAVLKETGLPREHFATLGDTFKRGGIVSSPMEEKASMIFALSQELSRTVSEIDGVLRARVHLVLPENDPLRQQFLPSSASVVVHHDASVQMASFVPQIKMVVANGVSGLAYDKVSVALFPVEKKPHITGEPQRKMTSILGIWVHTDSLGQLVWVFVALLVIITSLGGVLGLNYWRRAKRVYRLAPLADDKKS
jgi:type III secretion protein J